MKIRRITSLTALMSFLLLILTSAILYIVPQGRVAYWADWRLWGLTKTQWGDIHINLGVLLLISILLHIYYNWKPILSYLKDKTRQLKVFTREFNVALTLVIIVVLGTYFELPPFSNILNLSESIFVLTAFCPDASLCQAETFSRGSAESVHMKNTASHLAEIRRPFISRRKSLPARCMV